MKNKTNVQIVTSYMNTGSPLNQVFVIEAITKYAEQVRNQRLTVIDSMKNTFVSGEAWVQCADEWAKIQR
jgi:hypothetical protein